MIILKTNVNKVFFSWRVVTPTRIERPVANWTGRSCSSMRIRPASTASLRFHSLKSPNIRCAFNLLLFSLVKYRALQHRSSIRSQHPPSP